MAYTVPGVTLIKQTKTMSCWYASAQMVIQWRRNQMQMTEMGIMDPSEDGIISRMKDHDHGISNSAILHFAKKLGLVPVPPMSPAEATIETWLRAYGPLWVNGKSHIVVIGGIRPGEVLVYDPDPDPSNVGPQWRSLSNWYVGSAVDSRDTGWDVEAVFLHCPTLTANPKAKPDTHTVARGDSLWKIAARYYNDGSLWPFIYAANRGKVSNPNLIHPGQVLTIP
jgi:hypothetical protein